ncbi:beta prime cop protein, putative, partial [Trypanosoma cruzi]
MILLDGLIGDDDALAVVPQRARTSLAWKKASQNKRGGKISQLCRIPQELTSIDSTERHVNITNTESRQDNSPGEESPAVPTLESRVGQIGELNRRRTPQRRHSAAHTPTQRSATRSIQKPLAHAPPQARGHGRQQPADSTPCVRSSSPERTSHEIRCSNAQQTPEGQPPHEAAGGKSNRTPKAIPAATDPEECKGSRPPNNYGRARP